MLCSGEKKNHSMINCTDTKTVQEVVLTTSKAHGKVKKSTIKQTVTNVNTERDIRNQAVKQSVLQTLQDESLLKLKTRQNRTAFKTFGVERATNDKARIARLKHKSVRKYGAIVHETISGVQILLRNKEKRQPKGLLV